MPARCAARFRCWLSLVASSVVLLGAAPVSSPYGTTPASIPGIVQAENFDSGGTDVAYQDADEVNAGGQYRLDTGVDIEATSDTGDGANVGWMTAGEWLQYTIDVSSGGSYIIEARVAANGPGGTFHIEVNGSDLTGPLVIPNTYGWQNWTNVSRASVSLPAGPQILRVVLDANGPTGVFGNLNYLRFTSEGSGSMPHDGIAAVIPGVVQAENFDDGGEGLAYHDEDVINSGVQYRDTGVDIEATSDAGKGANVGWMTAGEWLQYTIDVASGGSYIIEARVAANGPGGTFHIEVNGSDVTGPLVIPNTYGWQYWTTVSRVVSLQAGRQALRVVVDANGRTGVFGNLNYLRVSPINADTYEVAGIVTDDQGRPLPGAVVTMAHWLGATVQFPSVVTDAAGGYRISFTSTAISLGQFVARAQVAADGYDEYWRTLSRGSVTSFVENFRLTRITGITAGDWTVLSVPVEVGECMGWVAQVCPVVRVMVPTQGNVTIEVAAIDQNAEKPPLEVCCVDGDERYGNPITVAVPAGEIWLMVGMERGFPTTRSFVVKTSLEPF